MIASARASRRRRTCPFSASLIALTLGAGFAAAAAATTPQKTFRSAVDLIAVDVQVVDGQGNPIERLGPDAFDVSIQGHKRKVVSAVFVRNAPAARGGGEQRAAAPSADASEEAAADGRMFILAIDSGSFDIGSAHEPMEAVQTFLNGVQPADRVGLFVYPTMRWIAPTRNRAPLRVSIARIVGEKQPIHSRYNLKPAEIVDITTESTNPNAFLTAARIRAPMGETTTAEELDPVLRVQRRECPEDVECASRIYSEGMDIAVQLEHQAQSSLTGLQFLLSQLTGVPGRKAIVLVSAGILVSDRVDGRPDVGNIARVMGQTAARANATVYTVHMGSTFSPSSTASQRGSASSDGGRDRALFSNWLDEFSSAAGGKRIYVPVGSGDFAFERVLRESSAYYLLGVEPQETDRDGQAHELKVKVNRRRVTVRSRQWVIMPAGV